MIRRTFLSRFSFLSTLFCTGVFSEGGSQKRIDVGAYQCLRCNTLNYVDFPADSVAEPDLCRECGSDGPYQISFDNCLFK